MLALHGLGEVVPGADCGGAGCGLLGALVGRGDECGAPASGEFGGGAGRVGLDDEGADALGADALEGFEAAGRSGFRGV